MPWSSEEVRTLIAEYKKRPCLWNAYLQDYKDRVKKVDSWKQLANIFNKDKIEVEKKIHALRVQFSEEVRKYEKKRTESGLDEPPKSSWQYFDALRFIQAGAKRRKRASHTQYVTSSLPATEVLPNLSSETEAYAVSPTASTSYTHDSTSYTHDSTSVATRNEHKMATLDPKSQEQILEKTLDIISRPAETDTEYNTFGTYSASELQAYESNRTALRLKNIMLSALLRASTENKAGDEDEMAYQRDEELFQQQPPPPEISDDFHQASTSFKKIIKKRKPSDEHQYMDSPMDFVQTSTASNDTRDEFSIFADYVASELRTIGDRRALAVAKHNINTVLFEATTGMYDQQIANGHD